MYYCGALVVFFVSLAGYFSAELTGYSQILQRSTETILPEMYAANQTILIVIDALRYDYLSRFKLVKELTEKFPQQVFTSKCSVGSPTMTTPRIEAMMTGSDIFSVQSVVSNFFSQQVAIDNLISQLKGANKTTSVFGDDTWTSLFSFDNAHVCASTFDIRDLDSCDNLIYRYLPEAIKSSDSLLIAHFLSIDHIGHSTSSLDMKQISLRLDMISQFLSNLIDTMGHNSVLIVTGDHGMRPDGNHGGNSVDQTDTFIFGYYKGSIINAQQEPLYKFNKGNTNNIPVLQTDLTPTLAIYLGVALPANSVGYPILGLLPRRVQSLLPTINTRIQTQYSRIINFHGLKKLPNTTESMTASELVQIRDNSLNSLAFSTPNYFSVVTALVSMLMSALVFGWFAYRRISLVSLLQVLASMVPFTIYFSWYLIRNLSSLLSLVVGLTLLCNVLLPLFRQRGHPLITATICLFWLWMMCQNQPPKINEYVPGLLRSEGLSSWFKTQSTISTLYCLIFVGYFVSLVGSRKLRQKGIKTSKGNSYEIIIKLSIVFLNLINQLMSQHINISNLTVTIRCTIILLLVIYSFVQFQQQIPLSSQVPVKIRFMVVNFLAIMMGLHSPQILLPLCLIFSNSSLNSLSSPTGFLVAELAWWMMGNRYEYSSIDISRSYIFSEHYNFLLNSLCLLVYLLSPYILTYIFLVTYRLEHNELISNSLHIPVTSQSEPQNTSLVSQTVSGQSEHNESNSISKYEYGVAFKSWLQTQNCKYVLVSVLAVLSCSINLLINNGKILFTIIYVPLLVFTTAKCIGVVMLNSLVQLWLRYRLRCHI